MHLDNFMRLTLLFYLIICSQIQVSGQIMTSISLEAFARMTNQICWGSQTNGIKSGLSVYARTNPVNNFSNCVRCESWLLFQTNAATVIYSENEKNISNSNIYVVVGSGIVVAATNNYNPVECLFPPQTSIGISLPWENNVRMRLKDENGIEVTRTGHGKQLRRALVENRRFVEKRNAFRVLQANKPYCFFEPFYLDEYFKITKPGKYVLQFQMRIFGCYTTGKIDQGIEDMYKPIYLPPVEQELTIP